MSRAARILLVGFKNKVVIEKPGRVYAVAYGVVCVVSIDPSTKALDVALLRKAMTGVKLVQRVCNHANQVS